MPNKERAFERGETYCGYCKYLRRELYSGDPAVACDSSDGYEYECTRKYGKDRTACARAAKAELHIMSFNNLILRRMNYDF